MKIKLTGYHEALANARRWEDLLPLIMAKALHNEGQRIKRRAQELTPVVTGTLRASAYIDAPVFHPGHIATVELGFNREGQDGPAPYAVRAHETKRYGRTGGTSPQGRPYPPRSWSTVGQWKFLETARDEHIPTSKERILADVKAGILASLK